MQALRILTPLFAVAVLAVAFGQTGKASDETAASAPDPKPLVLVSSQGVTDDDHPLNKMFNNVLIWKRKGEEAVAASGITYTIVRPGGLNDGPGGVKAIDFQQGDKSAQGDVISRADVARVCVAALEYADARNKVFEIQAKDGETQTDFAAEFAALAES